MKAFALLTIVLVVAAGCTTFNQTDGDTVYKDGAEVAYDSTESYQVNARQDALPAEALKRYDQVALERFRELTEYLIIATNPNLNADFRREAGKIIYSNIISGQELSAEVLPDKVAFEDKLEGYRERKFYEAGVDTIRTHAPLQYYRPGVHRGKLILLYGPDRKPISINVFLLKVIKQFGEEKQEIWEVKFSLPEPKALPEFISTEK